MRVDLGVKGSSLKGFEAFCRIAHTLGYSGFAALSQYDKPIMTLDQMEIYRRVDIKGKNVTSVRKQIDKVRRNSVIVSLEIGLIETTNWAVEDNRIDLLTINAGGEHHLRDTTAHMAASSTIALEVQIAPLLQIYGFNRSKILKIYRDSIATANRNHMMVVLTSGATAPMGMRSPDAMIHIGMLLGLEKSDADRVINEIPAAIVQRNIKKLDSEYIGTGVEVVQRGSEV